MLNWRRYKVEQVKTAKELGFPEPEIGYEWDAGNTPFSYPVRGRWTVRRDLDHWTVFFYHFSLVFGLSGHEEILQFYPPTEVGERQAKQYALDKVMDAWNW